MRMWKHDFKGAWDLLKYERLRAWYHNIHWKSKQSYDEAQHTWNLGMLLMSGVSVRTLPRGKWICDFQGTREIF